MELEGEVRGMARLQMLRRVVWTMPGWQMYLSQLHNAAGVQWPDEGLIMTALGEAESQLASVVRRLPEDEVAKRMVIENYRDGVRQKENAPVALGRTEAGIAGGKR